MLRYVKLQMVVQRKCVLILLLITGMIPFRCSGDVNLRSEDVLKNLLEGLDLDGMIPEGDSFPLPPQYMLELYRTYSGSNQDMNLKYKTANIIRSFSNKDESVDNNHYFFDLKDAVSKHEDIIGAELRYFMQKNVVDMLQTSQEIKVQLYEEQEKEYPVLLEEHVIFDKNLTWVVFSVKSSVEKWLKDPKRNIGLTVKVVDSLGYTLLNERTEKDDQSVLIVFSRNSEMPKSAGSTQDFSPFESNSEKNVKEMQYDSDARNTRNTRSVSVPQKDLCKRHEFRIDFGEIGWFPWIIEPKWYDAYACKGACVFGRNQNTTTHARMQSLVHHLDLSSNKGTPCCVPTALQPLSILFHDKHSNSVLAKFDDMVATDCGCR